MLFHRIIAQASGNPILAALIETITAAMYEKRLKTVQRANYLRDMAEMHREIFRAIRAHNPIEARIQMEHHLRMAESAQNLELPDLRPRRTAQTAALMPSAIIENISAQ
jgi:GntR family transcriptional repressor for pyruvate dehydrogenase complex